jgi:hypothetical protein
MDIISNTIFTNLTFYSIDGKIVAISKLSNNQFSLNIQHLSSGIYILKTKDASNVILTSKFVKQ